ncbi:hypothetical protein MAH1_32490 [Sessilibacter sp. MAH1]
MKFLRLFILFFVAAGFTAQSVIAEQTVSTVERKQIVELLPEDFKPAFTKETVIKLNAIVHRSFEAINDYDESVKAARGALIDAAKPDASEETKAMAMKKLAHISELNKQSKAALSDMKAAETELRNSDEEYNSAILAGMVDFVEDVEREISSQYTKLQAMMPEANS